jgi:hypothetical protein
MYRKQKLKKVATACQNKDLEEFKKIVITINDIEALIRCAYNNDFSDGIDYLIQTYEPNRSIINKFYISACQMDKVSMVQCMYLYILQEAFINGYYQAIISKSHKVIKYLMEQRIFLYADDLIPIQQITVLNSGYPLKNIESTDTYYNHITKCVIVGEIIDSLSINDYEINLTNIILEYLPYNLSRTRF